MPLDREKARAALLDTALGTDLDIVLDALEGCVTPRLAEVDARLVGEAEAKLARIQTLCEHYGQVVDGAERPYLLPEDATPFLNGVYAILDGQA